MRRTLLTRSALRFLETHLGASEADIQDVTPTDAGMTNRSFRFSCRGEQYILRVPGAGTEKLIDRRHEAAVYGVLSGTTIPDQVVAIDPETGYKLTRFWENTHNCRPDDPVEVRQCMTFLRQFHEKGFQVDHKFDLFWEIDFYAGLRNGPSEYPDYDEVYGRCQAMRPFLQAQKTETVLTHIDAVPDNFLFVEQNGQKELHLIDWEYAGMHDPHADIAMFAIYAGYDRAQLDQLIDWYFPEGCSSDIRLKIYCFVALSGLLWSNWCEYKKALGVDFGDYARSQYRYASEYSALFLKLLDERGGTI